MPNRLARNPHRSPRDTVSALASVGYGQCEQQSVGAHDAANGNLDASPNPGHATPAIHCQGR